MKSMLYKVSVITVSAIGVNLVDAGMKLWDTGYYGASVLGFSLAFASYFGASCLMDMFAKIEGRRVMEGQDCVVYSPYLSVPTPEISIVRIPTPRKVSHKERRKKARYRRSQGIRTKGGE